MKEGRKPEYPEKTPGDELQKMPVIYVDAIILYTDAEGDPDDSQYEYYDEEGTEEVYEGISLTELSTFRQCVYVIFPTR